MVAYAMHSAHAGRARDVRVHPDGEHGKQFDFAGWLGRRAFTKSPASVAPPMAESIESGEPDDHRQPEVRAR
jgi:hypothetical protein